VPGRWWLQRAIRLALLGALACGARSLAADGLDPVRFAAAACPGDLVFRAYDGFWGRLAASFSRRDRRYSHVGILVAGGNRAVVVHADGNPLRGEPRLQSTPLAQWLLGSERAGLYRLAVSDDARHRIAIVADRLLTAEVKFDTRFDLRTADALYCTELVDRVVVEAITGSEMPLRFERSELIDGRAYLPLDALYLNPHVREVLTYP
jgi:hypothetical protein